VFLLISLETVLVTGWCFAVMVVLEGLMFTLLGFVRTASLDGDPFVPWGRGIPPPSRDLSAEFFCHFYGWRPGLWRGQMNFSGKS